MDSDDEPLTSLASKPVPPPVKIEPPKPPPTSQSVPPPSGDKPAASPSESKGDTGDNMTEVERAKYKARLKEIRYVVQVAFVLFSLGQCRARFRVIFQEESSDVRCISSTAEYIV